MTVCFDNAAEVYDNVRAIPDNISEQITDSILNVVCATQETKFLEVGVGTGRIALPIVKRGHIYTGIDTSQKMMEKFSQKIENIPCQLNLIKSDATSLPFENNTFDVALAVLVLHLIPNWQKALAEIRRVLKPTGIFLYYHGRIRSRNNEQPDSNNSVFELDQKWQSILRSYQLQPSTYGATEAEVLDLFHKQGAKIETVIAAQWKKERTLKELIHSYCTKGYSSSWQIPDEIFIKAIADLTAWCQQKYYSLDVTLARETQFKLFVVKNWAGK